MKKLFNKILNIFDNPLEALLILILFSITLYFNLEAFTFKRDSSLFPLITSSLTLIFIVIYVAKLIIKQKRDGTESVEDSREKFDMYSDSFKRISITFISFLVYVLLTYLFGFLLSSVALMISYPLMLNYRKTSSIIIGVISVIGLVLLFQFSLNIPLSNGVLLDLSFLF
ncbi:MAG: tripartite tricarboxylate transporter TctB family protein [Bacillota bacterium]